jgi:hypothetical protein
MEPLSELATQITSHLWVLHDLDPTEKNPEKLRARTWDDEEDDTVAPSFRIWWVRKLQAEAACDYSRLQGLFDLVVGEIDPTDWDPTDPIKCIHLVGEIHAPDLTWNPLEIRGRLRQRRLAREKSEKLRTEERVELLRQASISPLAILASRIDGLHEVGMLEELDFDPSDTSAGPELLTREELFARVARWICIRAPERDASLGNLKKLRDLYIPVCDKETGSRFMMEHDIARRILSLPQGDQELKAEWDLDREEILLDRRRLREFCSKVGAPSPFSLVLSDELDEIARSRRLRYYDKDPATMSVEQARLRAGMCANYGTPYEEAFDANLFGVALSGGGIRSATFALGLLQGMADRNILPYVDILSTVSGGGYIGSWLISWIKRRGSIHSVQESLRGNASSQDEQVSGVRWITKGGHNPTEPLKSITRNADPRSDHVRPVRLLREYSRYLAPQAGVFSADTWTIAATWVRNTLLNLMILVLLFAAAMLVPRLAVFAMARLSAWTLPGNATDFFARMLIASIPLFAGLFLIGRYNLTTFGAFKKAGSLERTTRGDSDLQVVLQILPCILIGAFLQIVVLWTTGGGLWTTKEGVFGWIVMLSYSAILLIGMSLLLPFLRSNSWKDGEFPVRVALLAIVGSTVAGASLVAAIDVFLLSLGKNTERGVWIASSLGLTFMLAAFSAAIVVFLGLFGKQFGDEQREWWSRLGAWLGLAMAAWLVACAISFFVPLWIAQIGLRLTAIISGVGWAGITAAGLKLAFSPPSGRQPGNEQNPVAEAILNIAPFVFAAGLLSAVSFGLYWVIQLFLRSIPTFVDNPVAHRLCCSDLPLSLQRMLDYYWPMMYPGSWAAFVLTIVFFGLAWILARRVDVNEFSMHHFYKNRLVRAYLGASRARNHRWPNAFTGFDLEDDIRLFRFCYDDKTQPRDMLMDCKSGYIGPFPIINTTLNVTQGADLGLQERKAESFTFTPLWSGFDFSRRQISVKSTNLSEYAFRRTEEFGEPQNHGAFLGTAMAISGAAFNSNAGFHTSPSLAFLLTVFGVRLGWWAGNPRRAEWRLPSPNSGLLYLARELSANTDTNSPFVLLSDGGHFENMGLYELVRRRCRYVVLSDAEEDAKFKLEGIGGAIRKCRDDFGVVIDLNLDALEPLGDPAFSRLHYSIGTIIYPGETAHGKLVYIKSSVTGDEPVDIVEFRKRHCEFPHTSTVNQFFDESHFESYRALGHHVASGVFGHDMDPLPADDGTPIASRLEKLFAQVEKDWGTRIQFALRAEKATSGEAQKGDQE